MGRLRFLKRLEFTPSRSLISLTRADIYGDGRKLFVFLTLHNPEHVYHEVGVALVTPYDDEREPIAAFKIRMDLSLVPPGGTFTYPDEIPFPMDFESFNFEWKTIDGSIAPKFEAMPNDLPPVNEEKKEVAPEEEGILPTKKPRLGKTIKRVRFANRTVPIPTILIALGGVAGCSIGALLFSRFSWGVNPLAPSSENEIALDGVLYEKMGEEGLRLKKLTDGSRNSITIPSEINQIPVTRVAKDAFYALDYLTDLNFLSETIEFERSAIHDCRSLESIRTDGKSTFGAYSLHNLPSLQTLDLGPSSSMDLQQGFGQHPSISFASYAGKVNNILQSGAFNLSLPIDRYSTVSLGNSHVSRLDLLLPQGVTVPNNLCSGAQYLNYVSFKRETSGSYYAGIGNYAFNNCTSLSGVEDNSGLIGEIGERAFYGCNNLNTVSLPACTRVRSMAFRNSSLREIYLSENATYSDDAFENGTLVHRGSSITVIDNVPTTSAEEFKFVYQNDGGTYKITSYTGSPGDSIEIPSYADGYRVTSIDSGALANISCREITGGAYLSSIGPFAFNNSNVSRIDLSSEYNLNLDAYSLSGANALTEFYTSGALTPLGILGGNNEIAISARRITGASNAFENGNYLLYIQNVYQDDLECLLDNNGVLSLNGTYMDSVLTSPTSSSLTPVSLIEVNLSGDYSVQSNVFFAATKLSLFDWGGVNRIEEEAFLQCAFESIYLPDKCSYVGHRAFAETPLGSASLYRSTVYEEDSFPGRTVITTR